MHAYTYVCMVCVREPGGGGNGEGEFPGICPFVKEKPPGLPGLPPHPPWSQPPGFTSPRPSASPASCGLVCPGGSGFVAIPPSNLGGRVPRCSPGERS